MRYSSRLLAALLLLFPVLSIAQEWIKALPQKDPEELNFYEIQSAFYRYYGENVVPLVLDKVKPTFRFEGREAVTRKAIDEYKMFKRWEWFTEPRVYPTGRWDNKKILAEIERVPMLDKRLLERIAVLDTSLFFPLTVWKPMGPADAIGGTNLGRVNCIAIDPSNTKTIYIGAPNGGVWKTTDFGSTWATTTDKLPTLSIADIAIDPVNTKNIYIASGDGFGYGVPFWGGTYTIGVWKSADAGTTWSATGLSFTVGQTTTIRRLVIHPTNPKILLAATSSGLYRTADAGATWTQLWNTSTFDAEFNPSNGSIVYATTSLVKKSTDGGVTWSDLTASCAGSRYNIEIALSNTKVLYTLCTNGTVQKSTDAGTTWTTTAAPGVTLYGYYDNVLSVSPTNASMVMVAGFNIKKTTDGGATWSAVPTAGHVDNHCIEFLPGSSSTIFCGNDGGLFRTTNTGTTWSSLNKGLAITQFYRLGLSTLTSTLMIAGAQDNGNMRLNAGAWSNITNADGMEGFIDFANNNNIYAGIQNGSLLRSTDGGATWTGISTPSGGAWVTPWCQSKTVANTIYAGTNKVYRSTNQGTTWTAISPLLAGIGTFTVLDVNKNSKIILAGSGNKLYRTTDAGTTWTDITAGLPVASNFLMDVVMSDNDHKMIWAVFSGYNAGQKVYKSIDGGATWTNISGSLPNMPVNCVVYENKVNNPIYIGTDAGVYYFKDGLADFVPYKTSLPNVIIDELEIHYGSKRIRAATYGRGLWDAPLKL